MNSNFRCPPMTSALVMHNLKRGSHHFNAALLESKSVAASILQTDIATLYMLLKSWPTV